MTAGMETYRYFDLPRGGRFRLLADWWLEAGMDDFQRETEAYLQRFTQQFN